MKSKILAWLTVALVTFMFGGSVLAQSDSIFVKANEEYAHGQFQEAIRDYESLVKSGEFSAPLFYNLGNAYFRNADFAHAILNYERTLSLEPRHAEAIANLALARDEARALELRKTRPEHFLEFATSNQITVAAAIAFWIATFAIAAMVFDRRRSAGLILLCLVALVVTAVSVASVYLIENKAKSLAIVTRSGVDARVATADNANSVLALPPGSEIQIVSKRGDWIYGLLPNNSSGWIPANSVEPVRL